VNHLSETLCRLGATLNSAAPESAVLKLEHELGSPLPSELREFYLANNGYAAPMDESMWDWWPVERLASFSHHYSLTQSSWSDGGASFGFFSKLVLFADALIECPVYGVLLDSSSSLHGHVYGIQADVPSSFAKIDKSGAIFTAARSMSSFIAAFEKDYSFAVVRQV
jgi:hypothetical protein